MPEFNHPFVANNKHEFWNASWRYQVTFFFLILFVFSLPFNGIEWKLISISRFELKITMITFPLLFISWLLSNFKFHRKRNSKEIIFYIFAFVYGVSQFTSLINSPFPFDSIKQGIIIASLLTMMVVTSETVLDRKMAEYALTTIGTLSLIIGIVAVLNYYLISGYAGRLGQRNPVLGIIGLGGDPYYFGDILLYSIGPVFFVLVNLFKRKYLRWLIPLFLMLWFSAIVLTFAKALLLSVCCFFLCSLLLLKGRRSFMLVSMILFLLAILSNYQLQKYLAIKTQTRLLEKKVTQYVKSRKDFIELMRDKKFLELLRSEEFIELARYKTYTELMRDKKFIELMRDKKFIELMRDKKFKELVRSKTFAEFPNHYLARMSIFSRLDILSNLGFNSLSIRLKAVVTSLISSLNYKWFGHGAGLSQKLLPKIATEYDRTADDEEKGIMKRGGVYGEAANRSLIDSHVFFLTEFFNVGIVGLISLICLVVFVIVEQVKTIKADKYSKDNMNELLFTTLISMLIYRLSGSLIVIPFLWFMLGLGFGVCKLY